MKKMFNTEVIREMQNQNNNEITSQLSKWSSSQIQTTNVSGDVERKEPLCTAAGKVNWHNFCGGSLKKLKIELPNDPGIPLLASEKINIVVQKDICTPMSTAALFTISKIRSNPSVHQQNKEIMVCTHIHKNTIWNITLPIKRNSQIPVICKNMDTHRVLRA